MNKIVVWNENVHEQRSQEIRAVYPNGIHAQIASILRDEIPVETATLQDSEHGLSEERLAQTDVLLWW